MPIGLERDYRLRWMDFDRYGRLKPEAILDIFQDVATIQAQDMGIGDDTLAKKGVFWVVTRVKLEVVQQPQPHTRVIARTWPHTQTKLSFLRDYTLRTEDGVLLVKATSEWMIISYEKRSFVSALESYDGPQDFDDARAFDAKPKKIKNFDEDPARGVSITPSYSDIDKNGHVNNAMYAKFSIDALDPGREGALKTMQIDYRHEIIAGSPVTLYVDKGDAIRVKGVLESGDVAFMAQIETA